jgi:FkbM family methyltransferase
MMDSVGDLVSVVGKAVGKRTDVADLTLGVVPSWSSLTSYTPQSAVLGKVKVEIVPLDLMLENWMEGPLVIKIDVEGAGLAF